MRAHDIRIALGYGRYQRWRNLLYNGVWFVDGTELLLISSVSQQVSKEWGMNNMQRGSLVSIVFLGIFLGNVTAGPLGDRYGRRLPLMISYIFIFLFSILSTLAWDFWSLAVPRLLVGWAFGVGQPAAGSSIAEIFPPDSVNFGLVMGGQIVFTLGYAFAVVLIATDNINLKVSSFGTDFDLVLSRAASHHRQHSCWSRALSS